MMIAGDRGGVDLARNHPRPEQMRDRSGIGATERARRSVQNTRKSRQERALARELAKTHFERVLANAAQISMVIVAVVASVMALQQAQVVLAPVFLAIIVGLMFGP